MEDRLIGGEVRKLQNLLGREIDSYVRSLDFKGELISGPNMFICKYIMEHEGEDIHQCDLEKVLQTTKSTCSKVLSTMERKGLIQRVNACDNRYKKVVITDFGKEIVTEFDKKIYAHDKTLTEGLSEDEVNTFLHCLEVIKNNCLKNEKINKQKMVNKK